MQIEFILTSKIKKHAVRRFYLLLVEIIIQYINF